MRMSLRRRRRFIGAVMAMMAISSAVAAGALPSLQRTALVSGFIQPVAMVPDPLDPSTFYVVERLGRVVTVRNLVKEQTPFADLSGSINTESECGLLGMAFSPDFAQSRRVFVCMSSNGAGPEPVRALVIARFTAPEPAPGETLRLDPSTRFDLEFHGMRWIGDTRRHNGGTIAFGPDGMLYIGLGDGEGSLIAQSPTTLRGKMLRIDTRAPAEDPVGYSIPESNPFRAENNPSIAGALEEIWAFGLRNPWKWTFDDRGANHTGAMILADVGQTSWEEINIEPAGAGGRNYGWAVMEGNEPYNAGVAPAYLPLTPPTHVYPHPGGGGAVAGYVYRSGRMCPYFGRVFFADLSGRVWTMLPDGSDVLEHTTTLWGTGSRPYITSFGRDARGELYLLGYSTGILYWLRTVGGTLEGDYTLDGAVDFFDLNHVLTSFGQGTTFFDLNRVLVNYGRVCGSAG